MQEIHPGPLMPPTPVLPPQMQSPVASPAKPVVLQTPPVNDSTAEHRGRVTVDGMPYVGPALALTEDEYAAMTVVCGSHVVRTFNTGDPKENAEFVALMDRVSRDSAIVRSHETRWTRLEKGKPPVMFVYVHVEFLQRRPDMDQSRVRNLVQRAGASATMPMSLDAARADTNTRLGGP